MLGQRQTRFVVAFSTTSDAIGAEKILKKAGVAGRLIPVPRRLSAGCGMAWAGDPADEKRTAALLREGRITPEQSVVMEI